jgi:hypothetical protein
VEVISLLRRNGDSVKSETFPDGEGFGTWNRLKMGGFSVKCKMHVRSGGERSRFSVSLKHQPVQGTLQLSPLHLCYVATVWRATLHSGKRQGQFIPPMFGHKVKTENML